MFENSSPASQEGRRRSFRLAAFLTLATVAACSSAQLSPEDRSGKPAQTGMAQANSSRASIDQIVLDGSSLQAAQIPSGSDTAPLTVAQLRAYRDRCAPDAEEQPPTSVNCEELRLRIEKTFRNDDEVANALATLDRLTAPETADLLTRLESGDLRGLDAQAVASGILNTETGPVSPDGEIDKPELENIEEAIGAIPIFPQ